MKANQRNISAKIRPTFLKMRNLISESQFLIFSIFRISAQFFETKFWFSIVNQGFSNFTLFIRANNSFFLMNILLLNFVKLVKEIPPNLLSPCILKIVSFLNFYCFIFCFLLKIPKKISFTTEIFFSKMKITNFVHKNLKKRSNGYYNNRRMYQLRFCEPECPNNAIYEGADWKLPKEPY